MKALIAVLVLFASFQTQARSVARYTDVHLDVQVITENSPLFNDMISSAFLKIDHFENSAKLILHREPPACPPGMFCTLGFPAPLVIEFENLEVSRNECQAVRYKAVIDDSAIDGLVETLTITDNRSNICEYLVFLPEFQVSYETLSPRTGITSKATFTGPRRDRIKLPVQPLETM